MGKKCGAAIDRFEKWWFGENEGSLDNWKSDYWKVLKHLPRNHLLSKPALTKWVQTYAPHKDNKKRLRACSAIRLMALHGAGLTLDFSKIQGDYQSNGPDPRTIPTDKRICQTWLELEHNPAWQWIYGVLATYGLRPHESLLLNYDLLRKGNPRLHVLEGKTGERYAMPYHPEWFHDFALHRPRLPPVNFDRSHIYLGQSVTRYLSTKRLGHAPMDLRHAYAIRTMRDYNVKDEFAARWMGHGIEVHRKTYWRWITAIQERQEYQRSLGRMEASAPRPKLF